MTAPDDALLASLPYPNRNLLTAAAAGDPSRPMAALALFALNENQDKHASLANRALELAQDPRAHAYITRRILSNLGQRSGYDQTFQQGLERLKQTCRSLNNRHFSLLPLGLMRAAACAEGDLDKALAILRQAQTHLAEGSDSDPATLEWHIHELTVLQDLGHWCKIGELLTLIADHRHHYIQMYGKDWYALHRCEYLTATWHLHEVIQEVKPDLPSPHIIYTAIAMARLGDPQGGQRLLERDRALIHPRTYNRAQHTLAVTTGNLQRVFDLNDQWLAMASHHHRLRDGVLAESALLQGRPQQARIAIRNRGSEANSIRMRIALYEDDVTAALPFATAILDQAGKGGLRTILHEAIETRNNAPLRMWLAATEDPRQIGAATVKRQTPKPVNNAPQALNDLVGSSSAMKQLRHHMSLIAQRPEPVLITGETGTGKELVAHALHLLSRAERPFIAVNCSGLVESLAEATLFGHRKGSFTGAHDHNHGLIHLAEDGVLFLDEIDSMPLSMQGMFLRVLESGDYWPVGASQPRKLKARIIAACQRPLAEAVARGRCREDLRYRLERLTVEIPALRDHPQDIPDLFHHFCAIMGEGPLPLPAHTLANWQQHSWPGNVRELRNEVERFVILGDQQPARALSNHTTIKAQSVTDIPTAAISLGAPNAARRRRAILELFTRLPEVSRKVVCQQLECAPTTAAADLQFLEDQKLIQRMSEGPTRLHYYIMAPGPRNY